MVQQRNSKGKGYPWPRPRPTDERRLQRKAMTIALGILASDGVVIAADSEESLGDIKYDQGKIRGTFEITPEGARRSLLMAGAGNAHHIDSFAQALETVVKRDPRIDTNPKLPIEQALERFYMAKIVPLSHYGTDRPDFTTVMGLWINGRTHLFSSEYMSLFREEKHAVIGLGAMTARPLLKRYFGRAGRVSVRQAVVMAAHAMLLAKEGVQGVGKRSEILAILNDGTHARTTDDQQEDLDRALRKYAHGLEPELLRSVLGRVDPTKVAKDITLFRESLDRVLGARFTPKSPVKTPVRKSPKRDP